LAENFDQRIEIESALDCCGFHNAREQMPSDWSQLCQSDQLERQDCCQLPEFFKSAQGNVLTTGFCQSDQTRLQCCGAPDTCVNESNLQNCQTALSGFAHSKFAFLIGFTAFVFVIEVIGLVVSVIYAIRAWLLPPLPAYASIGFL